MLSYVFCVLDYLCKLLTDLFVFSFFVIERIFGLVWHFFYFSTESFNFYAASLKEFRPRVLCKLKFVIFLFPPNYKDSDFHAHFPLDKLTS